jgi:hypothetical protein
MIVTRAASAKQERDQRRVLRGDHRGGMDQAHGRRAFHGVGQPDMQETSLKAGCQQQKGQSRPETAADVKPACPKTPQVTGTRVP